MQEGPPRGIQTPPALLAFVFAITFLTMPGRYYIGDPHYWQEEAIHFINNHDLWLANDSVPDIAKDQYAVFNPKDGHYHSKFGVMNAILTLPPLIVERLATGELPPARPPARVLFLNLYNVVLSVLIAAALYRLTARFSENTGHRVGYVVACLFATFLWNYLRAQSGEIYQVLLFAWFFEALLHWKDSAVAAQGVWTRTVLRHLIVPWLLLAALSLSRLSNVVLIPLTVLGMASVFWTAWPAAERRPQGLVRLLPLLAPALCVTALILLVNDLKFGSPLSTGYEEWRPEIHRWNGKVSDGVLGFLLDPQRSVFLCFPPLIAAAVGFPRYLREHRFEALFLAATFVAFLLALGLLPSWKGEWSYGPRYLAFLLPVVSLPALSFLATLREAAPGPGKAAAWAGMFVTILASLFLQVQVNRLWFFSYYQISDLPGAPTWQGETKELFVEAPFGWINYQLVGAGEDLEKLPYVRFLRGVGIDQEQMDAYLERLRKIAKTRNYYWGVMKL
jgi:hypothetical protein